MSESIGENEMPLQVYKGKGRRMRRVVYDRSGGLMFRLFSIWLKNGVKLAL